MPKILIYFIPLILLFASQMVGAASGASLILSPLSQALTLGDSFSVQVMADANYIPVNAAQATIHFPADKLEVLSISQEDSILTVWPQNPVFSNESGEVSFMGGLPQPGFSGLKNLITIEFRAKKGGTIDFVFDKAKILASDGKGTDVLLYLKSAKYAVFEKISLTGAQIFSLTHPQENEWYINNSPQFQWNLTPEITDISFVLDQEPETMPDTISEGRVQFKNYEKLSDGIWYFHLRFKDENGWQEAIHYKVQIDNQPPHSFEVVIDNVGDPTNPKPNLYFETNDETSGVSHYKLSIDEGSFSNLMLAQINPFSFSKVVPGQHPIVVRAVDQAGNNVETKTMLDVEPIETPIITIWPQSYVSGEEVFYIEGQSVPETVINIFLRKKGENIKTWQTEANEKGEWSFSAKELIASGTYYLFSQAEDERGALSLLSDGRKMEVSLSGLIWGSLIISSQTIVLCLSLILLLSIVILCFFIFRTRATKRILKKETKEASDSLHQTFTTLSKQIEKQIELFDSRPGFSEKEKKVYQALKNALSNSEERIKKEIEDIERELGEK